MATDSTNHFVQIKPVGAKGPETAPDPMPMEQSPRLELDAVREKLSGAHGPKYWRSLEELTEEPGFDEMMQREFPRQASEWIDPVSRRGFLKLMSASLALAGLSACTKQPDEAIVPYVQQPEELIPGKPMYFASARPTNFGAQPLLVKSNMYRPTKVDGNPEHPFSQGATDAYSQASILDLYDPDRLQAVMYNGGSATHKNRMPGENSWGEFLNDLKEATTPEKSKQGSGIRFLTETVISPTLADQIKSVLKAYPQAKWYQYDGVNRDSARAGSRMAFGQYVDAQYQLENADIIVSLDADFLSGAQFPGFLKLARDFAKKRKLESADPKKAEMSRLYVVESQTTTTGGKADHRFAMRAWEVEQFASALAAAVGAGGGAKLDEEAAQKLLEVMAKDLQGARGRCVVIPGEQQSPAVHALAAAMNSALGNEGKTVIYTDTVELVPIEQVLGLKELVADMNAGKVSFLVILGGNPVYTAPADLKFGDAMQKVALRASLSLYKDDTSRLCHWNIPAAHYLESWSDARAYDGTVSVVQPLVEPFYQGKTAHDVLIAFSDSPGSSSYDAVKAYWQSQAKSADFETWWRKVLHDGFVPNTAFAAKNVFAKPMNLVPATPPKLDLEIVFRPDPTIYDGRFVNNGWLQELPKPITKLTWDNAALVSQDLALNRGMDSQSVIEINVGGRKVQAPVMIVPGHPEKSITVHLGYGQEWSGRVGTGTGFDAYQLRTSTNPNTSGVNVERVTGKKWALAVTQHHHLINKESGFMGKYVGKKGTTEAGNAAADRELIRSATLEQYREEPNFANEGQNEPESRELTLYPNFEYPKLAAHQWGMSIDMNSCVGCNACVAACAAENNTAVVGKEQVLAGREMHWLRIDTYFEASGNNTDVANPRAYFQPIPCMQCENAPCEPVCPVAATVHSPEGLNNMVYNRCVGTRYCSNNCPYKVRRFNFLLFQDFETESLKGLRNPDVSVRSRGVMEKCTYCVQRINAGRIDAEKKIGQVDENGKPYDGKIKDGDVVTACQQSCPTGAIIFGDISDPNSRVNKLKAQKRNYALLAELNTRPRTTYLASVRNPHAELEEQKSTENAAHAG